MNHSHCRCSKCPPFRSMSLCFAQKYPHWYTADNLTSHSSLPSPCGIVRILFITVVTAPISVSRFIPVKHQKKSATGHHPLSSFPCTCPSYDFPPPFHSPYPRVTKDKHVLTPLLSYPRTHHASLLSFPSRSLSGSLNPCPRIRLGIGID